MSKKVSFFVFVLFYTSFSIAQSSIVTAGADITMNGLTINYSVGEPFCEYYEGEQLKSKFQSGVQQNFDNLIIELEKEISTILIYPNPTVDFLTVESDFKGEEYFKVFSLDGKIYKEGFVNVSQKNSINVGDLPVGEYILSFKNIGDKPFKFIKL